jgi:mono/diheme cytochrome c family protein
MTRRLATFFVAVVVVGMAATPASAQNLDRAFSSATRFMQRDGEVIYKTICAACHMPDGQGAIGAGTYPALARNAKLASGAYPVLMVVGGRNAMPSFERTLDDEQIAAVVNYVRTHFGNSYTDAVSAIDVKAASPEWRQ